VGEKIWPERKRMKSASYGYPIEYLAVPFELLPQQKGFSFFEGPYSTDPVA